jgi:hypothetical protein
MCSAGAAASRNTRRLRRSATLSWVVGRLPGDLARGQEPGMWLALCDGLAQFLRGARQPEALNLNR